MRLSLLIAATVLLVSQISFGQSDEIIQTNVQKALGAYSIKSINASVQGGGVTLTGSVDLCRTKILADQLTSGIPGVKFIWDRVQVAGPNVPDNELSKQIKNLIKDRIRRLGGFGFGSISVNVKNGVVTLSGYAAAQLAYPTTQQLGIYRALRISSITLSLFRLRSRIGRAISELEQV